MCKTTAILDFSIKYRSNDKKLISEMSVSVPKSFKHNKLSILVRQTKKRVHLHFDRYFISCSFKVNDGAILDFFLINQLNRNVH